jgi:hypothetical protein
VGGEGERSDDEDSVGVRPFQMARRLNSPIPDLHFFAKMELIPDLHIFAKMELYDTAGYSE